MDRKTLHRAQPVRPPAHGRSA